MLLDTIERDDDIHPINFNLHAYERDAAHEVKEAAKESRENYVEYKEEQQEVRDATREAERIENMAWYEKAWEYSSTFVGEATGYYDSVRATTGVDPVTGEELTAAERTKHGALAAGGFIPFVGWAGHWINLRKAEYGLYSITSANGLGEYATGRDKFGIELSEEQREWSLNEAFALLDGNAVGVGLRKINPTVNLGYKNIEKAPEGSIRNVKLSPSNYPNPDPPMSALPVKYKSKK